MATVHAGVKRSFQVMQASNANAIASPQLEATKSQCSVPREACVTPTRPNGVNKSRKVAFEPNASIVLIGVRGVGKSSLAFLAASAYTRRLIESDRAFAEATGSSRTAYRKLKGPIDYQRKHCQVLKRVLDTNDSNAVIVCSFADLESEGGKMIQDYAQSHPVIYISRDIPGIQNYIRVWSEERIQDLIRASEPLLRDCSNYEFFNVSETLENIPSNEGPRQPPSRGSNGPFLTLKRTEHDFLKLLRNVVGDHDRVRSHQSAYPLSQTSVDKLEFTSAVTLTADDVVSRKLDLDIAQVGVDAIQLNVSIWPEHGKCWKMGKHGCFNLVNEAFAILRRSTILPVIIAVAHDDRDGDRQTQLSRTDLLEYCLRLGPEYCTLDLSLSESNLRQILETKGRTQVIGEFVAVERMPDGWASPRCVDIYRRGQDHGCELIKITMPNGTLTDNFAIQAFQQRIHTLQSDQGPPVIAYCTGRQGRTSMCFNNILTPVAPPEYAYEAASGEPRSSLVTARERNQALFSSFVHEPMQFLIYGANVSFSLSPAMHNAAYEACGMRHFYRTHSASTLDDFVAIVQEHDFGGAAIVQPFKTKIIPMMDVLSPHAKAIGAINTVIPLREESAVQSINSNVGIFRERNRTGPVKALYGDNTDWIGIRACIRRGLSPANTVRSQTTGLVCGAGGMARAAVYSMISLGVQSIFICNRTKGNAEELAEHYNRLISNGGIAELSASNAANTSVRALPSFESEWPKGMRFPTMIVSCIPTQTMDGTPTNFTLPTDWLSSRSGGVVVELAYMPIVTPLVRQVQQIQGKGWILMDGLDMLPEQAFAQFELFTGRRAPRKLMRNEVFKHYSEDEFPMGGALNLDSPSAS